MPGGRARHGDHGQRVVRARGGVGAAHHGVQLAPVLVPSGAVGRVVLLARDHPLLAVAARDRLHPAGRVRRIEVCPSGHVGERVGRQQVTLEIIGERPQEPFLLLRRTVLDHRLQAQPGGQQRRRHVDVDAGEFLSGDGQVEHGEPGPAVFSRDERPGEASVRHLAVRLPAGQERPPPVHRTVDPAGDRPEHALGECACVLLQLLLAVAQREIDGHDRHLLPISFLSRVSLSTCPTSSGRDHRARLGPRGDGSNILEHSRLLQFVARVPEHLVLHGIASALASR